jgi:NAD(P)-dependent dehydrogenase (short-subunit alcohol dehydrogenase family)
MTPAGAPTVFVIDADADADADAAVAVAVEFLAAESGRYVTGQTLLVDGESPPARPAPWLRRVLDKPAESS